MNRSRAMFDDRSRVATAAAAKLDVDRRRVADLEINGVATTGANLSDSTPATPASATAVKFQRDETVPNNVSAYVDLPRYSFASLFLFGDG